MRDDHRPMLEMLYKIPPTLIQANPYINKVSIDSIKC